jgi:hypothetical protein
VYAFTIEVFGRAAEQAAGRERSSGVEEVEALLLHYSTFPLLLYLHFSARLLH